MHGDPIAPVILGVTTILAFAVIGRIGARKLGQPTVLGEVVMGILLGNIAWYLGFDLITVLREGARVFEIVNLALAGQPVDAAAEEIFGPQKAAEIVRIVTGPRGGEVMQVAHTVDVFSRYGIIFMLFMVGLNTTLEELEQVGREAIRVAIIGVLLPVGLGYVAVYTLRPDLPFDAGVFIAATLAATSIGISADVLEETGNTHTREGRIILGAAVGDDVLGLVLLALVTGVVVNGSVAFADVATVAIISALYLVAAFTIGPSIVRLSESIMRRLDIVEAKMFTSYLFVMVLAWSANLAGLATIIGAFAAGVILTDRFFIYRDQHPDLNHRNSHSFSIRELILPLEVILVPIFFILMGIQVKIESFLSLPVIIFALGLLAAAVLGKLAAGLGAGKGANRLAIGFGMLPRGEVGLVFAAIGRTLGVIDDSIFAAIVLMVIVTTLISPPILKTTLKSAA